jgi:D-threonate/D-erythronate kinase
MKNRPKIVVVADDFTGAAEIAGIAHLYGLKTKLLTGKYDLIYKETDVLVINTDTRNLPGEAAHAKIEELLVNFREIVVTSILFKKIDSALRGNITDELEVVLQSLGKDKVLLIPANPSKQRIIYCGDYYMDGKPLEETEFSYDPIYPQKTGKVKQMLNQSKVPVFIQPEIIHYSKPGIYIPDIRSTDDIKKVLSETGEQNFLHAGGSDFFKEFLQIRLGVQQLFFKDLDELPFQKLFVVGSRSETTNSTLNVLLRKNFTIHFVNKGNLNTNELFHFVREKLAYIFEETGRVALARPQHAMQYHTEVISKTLADMVKGILTKNSKSVTIFAEGGETASEIANLLHCSVFYVRYANKEGNVQLFCPAKNLTIITKPGSYYWSEEVLNQI